MEDLVPTEAVEKPWVQTERMKLEAAQKHLEVLLSVNRKLLSSVSEKERLVNQIKEDNKALRLKMECRGVEDPMRKQRIDELQAKLSKEHSQQADTVRTGSKVAILEQKIEGLNQDNLKKSETHRREKKKLDEQQQKMKMVTKRTKDLCKHIDFIALHLNEAQTAISNEAAQNGQPKLEYVDYRNLPGLHLSKLLLDDKQKERKSKAQKSGSQELAEPISPVSPS
eukprot:gnl/MRDRNA2_/MRDRNA2_91560_c0_seq1.p1 gnl/MRDRNA2_/MRDRNA2_91560_c0~~gnl/MRDRNA2_/MRDRNA2_91560_c0_seq1.p1  ORF type:complete len:246 (+),score=69.07 gnl/MRDRNA2_/MRDRNA2_91560_c0_seq1:66-740(+)